MARQVYNVAPSWEQQASLGKIEGVGTVNKFGRNTEIDSGVIADIWDGGKTVGALPAGTSLIWLAPTAAAVHNIASTSSSDDGDPVGVGLRTVKVFGLPDWDTPEVSETVIMNGTGNVATVNSYVIIHRMRALTYGASGPNVGTVTATATAPSATTVTARIEAGKGQTQMAVYGIPSTQTLLVGCFYASANKAAGAGALVDVGVLYNHDPATQPAVFLVKHPIGLSTAGTSSGEHEYCFPKRFDGPGILKIQAVSGTNNMDLTAGFDMALVTN